MADTASRCHEPCAWSTGPHVQIPKVLYEIGPIRRNHERGNRRSTVDKIIDGSVDLSELVQQSVTFLPKAF